MLTPSFFSLFPQLTDRGELRGEHRQRALGLLATNGRPVQAVTDDDADTEKEGEVVA